MTDQERIISFGQCWRTDEDHEFWPVWVDQDGSYWGLGEFGLDDGEPCSPDCCDAEMLVELVRSGVPPSKAVWNVSLFDTKPLDGAQSWIAKNVIPTRRVDSLSMPSRKEIESHFNSNRNRILAAYWRG